MKRLLVITAAMSLLLPGVPMAQSNQNGPPGAAKAGSRPEAPTTRPAPPANRPTPPSNRPGGPVGRPGNPGQPARPGQLPRPQPGRPQQGRPPSIHRPPPVAQPLPPRGNQFWHRGRYYGRIRGPAFAYPPGWHYRRWTIGAQLPALFLGQAYVYPGWAALGLEAPPPGYAWVRFGPDLIEVNLITGEVEDVVYGVFL